MTRAYHQTAGASESGPVCRNSGSRPPPIAQARTHASPQRPAGFGLVWPFSDSLSRRHGTSRRLPEKDRLWPAGSLATASDGLAISVHDRGPKNALQVKIGFLRGRFTLKAQTPRGSLIPLAG